MALMDELCRADQARIARLSIQRGGGRARRAVSFRGIALGWHWGGVGAAHLCGASADRSCQ